jgi:hypothetical protein
MGRKRLTDDERKQYEDLHSRADLTEDEDDQDPAPDDDDGEMEAMVIRGPGLKALLKSLVGEDTGNPTDDGAESGKPPKKEEAPKKDPKPPTQSKYFSGRNK